MLPRRPRSRSSIITLDNVARKAGVSKATVSRAITRPDKLSKATLERVTRASKQLGYVSHGIARALATGTTHTIGAVIPTLENAIYAVSTGSLERRLDQAGYLLLVACHEFSSQAETRAVRAFISRGVDGIVLVGLAHAPETMQLLRESRIPYVLTWSTRPQARKPTVGFDNRYAGRLIAEHLLRLGHQRVGMIAGITKGNDRAADRLTGVRNALANTGLKLSPELVVERPYSLDGGTDGLALLLSRQRPPTAIVCGNDILALGALREAHARKLDIPRELSITGFDNMPIAELGNPPLTTVHFPMAEIGWHSGTALLRALGKTEDAFESELAIRLIIRNSTAPPAGNPDLRSKRNENFLRNANA
ncbi:MAG: LacI family DNA-binding transcriptional regulator [Chloroflexota bacterium]